MFNKNRHTLLSTVAIAASAMLALGQTAQTHAVGVTPPSTTSTTVLQLSMARLNQRIDKLPELASLKNGDLVTIYDDGSVSGRTWEGTFAYHPAGTHVPMMEMYARWKDGLVAIHLQTDPADAFSDLNKNVMQPFATFVEQTYGTGKDYNGNMVQVVVSQQQVTKRLISEPTNSAILRIPGNAWLLREEDNGQYTTLVDTFEFKSGGTPVWRVQTATSNEMKEEGSQPVGVMYQF